MARKTQAERDREWRRQESLSWDIFKPQLERAASFAEAAKIVVQAAPESSPGRRWYRNLGFFLHYFKRPPNANHEEMQMYVAFLRRLAAAGETSPEGAEQMIKDLYKA
jgi:alpha-D-ribose 1-methylphosphonate 5-triphosphate diphosphatase PhnM